MKYLFNSKGQHIASFINGQLHSPSGRNIGHYLEHEKIFIDMSGGYLGELVMEDRLMYYRHSQYKLMKFGRLGNYGNTGNQGNPGNSGTIGNLANYRDIETPWL